MGFLVGVSEEGFFVVVAPVAVAPVRFDVGFAQGFSKRTLGR